MSRRKKPTAQTLYIWGELERVFQAYYGAPENRDRLAARARWQSLWEETASGDKLGTVPIEAAGDLLQWGWRFAMEDKRYDAATELMSAYFAHPEIEQDDVWTRIHHRCDLATSIMFSGDEATAVGIFRPLLECERKSMVRCAPVEMRSDLTYYLGEPASDEQALPALADLVEEVVNRLRRRLPQKKRLPENTTYADLQRLLEAT
jgi:hypothetical protein